MSQRIQDRNSSASRGFAQWTVCKQGFEGDEPGTVPRVTPPGALTSAECLVDKDFHSHYLV